MKFLLHLIFLLGFVCTLNLAQAQIPPQAFNYSAVARNSSGQPIATATIGIQISILKTSTTGIIVYSENHFVNTDAFGLFNLVVGGGAIQNGSMAAIDWSNDNYYLKVGMDAAGGTNFLTMGITQLLSVPYALHAKTAESILGGSVAESDPVYSGSVAAGISASDTANWNNKQDQLIAGNGFSISNNTINFSASAGGVYTHRIGELFGGGVVFHLWKDDQGAEHGLIVDLNDLASANAWSNVSTLIGNSAQSHWNGNSNSTAIVGQAGSSNTAAGLCLNSTNGGQTDWYLPSFTELNLLWSNYFNVSRTLSQTPGATVLARAYYWSSTENNATNAYDLSFGAGTGNIASKDFNTYVRAIRAF